MPESVQHLNFPVLVSFQVVSLATYFFFLQVGPFQRQGTFVQEEYTLFRKPEVVIHGSCLCDLLSHVFALLSVIHAELCDHAESEYAS